MSRSLVVVLTLLFYLLANPICAEDKRPYLQQMLVEDSDFASELARDFAEFETVKAIDLADFREERDADFAQFLKEQWEDFSEFHGLTRNGEPKPKVIPKAYDIPQDRPLPPAACNPPQVLSPPLPEPVPAPVVVLPPMPVPAPLPAPVPMVVSPARQPAPDPVVATPVPDPVVGEVPSPGRKVEVDYFGEKLVFVIDPQLANIHADQTNDGVSRFWEKASGADYRPLITQLAEARQKLALNDWGQYLLLQKLSGGMASDDNEAVLLSWFLLNKSNLRARIGFNQGRFFLLAPSRNTVYGVPFYQLDGERFYNLSYLQNRIKPGSIKTYRKTYPGVDGSLGFDLYLSPELPQAEQVRELSFTYKSIRYRLPAKINLNRIAFYRDYPDTDMKVFFSASVDSDAALSLASGLRPIIAGLSEIEAANVLLRFVQTAFDYQTDDEQFGGEKYMFAAETLHYPYSDCEDRAILFSYLVHELLHLEVVGLIYPGHAATAVHFNQPVGGDQVEINGVRYLVCDPTYVNADIGMAMPEFKQTKPEVVAIRRR